MVFTFAQGLWSAFEGCIRIRLWLGLGLGKFRGQWKHIYCKYKMLSQNVCMCVGRKRSWQDKSKEVIWNAKHGCRVMQISRNLPWRGWVDRSNQLWARNQHCNHKYTLEGTTSRSTISLIVRIWGQNKTQCICGNEGTYCSSVNVLSFERHRGIQ